MRATPAGTTLETTTLGQWKNFELDICNVHLASLYGGSSVTLGLEPQHIGHEFMTLTTRLPRSPSRNLQTHSYRRQLTKNGQQVANIAAKNDANLALTPSFHRIAFIM
ncbi:hypothetical protein TNCV_3783641 [Trichonephila clavipes]|nr:hypothetical protein TNCV_3783641 [Trichonephila clavipes]